MKFSFLIPDIFPKPSLQILQTLNFAHIKALSFLESQKESNNNFGLLFYLKILCILHLFKTEHQIQKRSDFKIEKKNSLCQVFLIL